MRIRSLPASYKLTALALVLLVPLLALGYYYTQFNRLIDQQLAGNFNQGVSQVFAAPRRITVGQTVMPAELVHYLQNSGYGQAPSGGALGEYASTESALEVRPGPNSYFAGQNALKIEFKGRRISRIRALQSGTRMASGDIEPEFITSLFDTAREKRSFVRFEDLPPALVNAILSAEDKRFFDHPGLDLVRVFGAARADLRQGGKVQGASTITMQVARSFFFSTRREWGRKLRETFMALLLEHRFTKKEIFELYANEVYLGNRATFAIRGFGEAARAYLGKDVRRLNPAESAFLAGIIRAPNRYSSADRRPERIEEARDRVLAQMVENERISTTDAEAARKTPVRLVSSATVTNSAGYFVDMVKDDLMERYSQAELVSENYRIYTSLDADLQRAAAQAIEWGMKNVDAQLARRFDAMRKRGEEPALPEVALVALDPATGEVRALSGGRDYTRSQLNRALARRQPGSVFKPFVYAAAFDNAVGGLSPVLTPASVVVDEPTTFSFRGQAYTPDNYGQDFYGPVTLRDALTRSLNVATVKVAEAVGYDRVARFAKEVGLDMNLQPTPALALGAYEMSPLQVAAGYTVFANSGGRTEPVLTRHVVGPEGKLFEYERGTSRAVLDPRVAYLVTSILEDVVNRGTGAGVRARGFRAPAAGKTGTSHDGWFAGYTSNLVCVVWVGFDDNRELGLSGSAAATPIWAEFMKRAATLPRYRIMQPFTRPEGIVFVEIDPETGELATSACPSIREEVFIAGTEPTETCSLHHETLLESVPPVSWLSRIFGGDNDRGKVNADSGNERAQAESKKEEEAGKEKKKRGIFSRIFGLGR